MLLTEKGKKLSVYHAFFFQLSSHFPRSLIVELGLSITKLPEALILHILMCVYLPYVQLFPSTVKLTHVKLRAYTCF